MACHLFGTKPLPESMPTILLIRPSEFNDIEISIKTYDFCLPFENGLKKINFDNVVCKLVAILVRPQCVNSLSSDAEWDIIVLCHHFHR